MKSMHDSSAHQQSPFAMPLASLLAAGLGVSTAAGKPVAHINGFGELVGKRANEASEVAFFGGEFSCTSTVVCGIWIGDMSF